MKAVISFLLVLVTAIPFAGAVAQTPVTYQRIGYTLTIVNNDATLDTTTQWRLAETFFEVYPKIAVAYNKQTLKQVAFAIDTAYKGVAATSDGRVVFNPQWFHKHPQDIDVVTHEVMHIAQDCKDGVGPGWLTEGIADYVRNQFGVNNEGAQWKLPDYRQGQSYTNSYRITARFLLWIEHKQKKGIVKLLDKKLREHNYMAGVWQQQTGKTLDQLWNVYSSDPSL